MFHEVRCYTLLYIDSFLDLKTHLQKEAMLEEEGWAEMWLCPSLSAAASTDPMVTTGSTSKDLNPTVLPGNALAAMTQRKPLVLFSCAFASGYTA